jgi:hypothetical protein
MNSKKRMMFVLEEDYYFIIIKLLTILIGLDCKKKSFTDYRKLGFIFEFIKANENMNLFDKVFSGEELNLFDNERLLKIFCDSNMDISVIKRVLFFLEKQNIISLEKNNKFSCIDVRLLYNSQINNLLNQDIFDEDIKNVKKIRKAINRVRSIKFETLQTKIFGYGGLQNGKISY